MGYNLILLCLYVHFTGVKLTPAEEEDLRKRWQHAVGRRYEVIVGLAFNITCRDKPVSKTNSIVHIYNCINM